MKCLILILLFISQVHATEWKKIPIPGAKCGDGKPYVVLVQLRDQEKLLVEFMGGGVCWDRHSCFERISLFPWLHNYPVINSYSIFTANKSKLNPFKSYSKIYFPYCTADVHVGTHESHYGDKVVFHYGRINIELAFQYLKEKELLQFNQISKLAVYGASAGGIASLVYGKKIESMIDPRAEKMMIVDSPGLHFGRTFWNKFDPSMKKDFRDAFLAVGLDVDFNDGVVSKKMAPVLENYWDWKIGFLIGLKDRVMSKVFGDISPEDHKHLVLGSFGLPAIARDFSNVKFWLMDTSMHTFLLSRYSASLKTDEKISAKSFVFDVTSNSR